MPEEPMAERALDRAWNDLIRGRRDAKGYAVDPSLLEAMRAFQGLAGTPPSQRSRDRVAHNVWAAIERTAAVSGQEDAMDQTLVLEVTQPPFGVNGSRGATAPGPRIAWGRPGWGRWARAQVATAALVVLTLVAGYAAFGPGRYRADEHALTPAPAVLGTPAATPAPGATSETLFEATFTPAELPTGDREATFYRVTLPPGTSMPYLAGPFCGCGEESIVPGVGVEVVQSGSYVVQLEAPLRVRRGGQATEEAVPPGTAVTLRPGDTVIYPDYAAPGEVRVDGDAPAVVTGVAITAPGPSGTPVPPLAPEVKTESLADLSARDWAATVGSGPVTVTLRRVVVPPGSGLGPYEPVGVEAGTMEAGHLKLGIIPRGEDAPSKPLLDFQAGHVMPFLPMGAGTRRTMESVGAEPAVLLLLAVAPAGGTATPAP